MTWDRKENLFRCDRCRAYLSMGSQGRPDYQLAVSTRNEPRPADKVSMHFCARCLGSCLELLNDFILYRGAA